MKYYIFDFDGTLVDSRDISLAVYNEMAGKYGFKTITLEELNKIKGFSVMEKCRYVHFPIFKLPFYAGEFYRAYKRQLQSLSLFEGVAELLKEIAAKGYGIAVISSNSEANIREFFQRNNLGHIDKIFCSNDIMGKDKMIKRFLKDNHLNHSDVLYIGDECRDIMACKKSGVKVAWVSWGYDLLESVMKEQPDFIVHKPFDLLDLPGALA
ncbi:MAG: HAD-IA family hydrolase [Clostridia bacterium]|nr:HAD-IA family hydrolase [Clostridia bacterium]